MNIVVMCKDCGYETTVMSWGRKKSNEHPVGGYSCKCENGLNTPDGMED